MGGDAILCRMPEQRGSKMSQPLLSVVASAAETPGARASRLLAEARLAADEQVHILESALTTVADMAAQIAEGGEIYPVGVRDLCRRMAEDASARIQTLEAMLQHQGAPRRR